MKKDEVLKLVRNICYRWHIEKSQKQLYALINGKVMPEDKRPKIIPTTKQTAFGVAVDSNMRDSKGSPIYFPKVGSHYDRALQRTFHSKKEKQKYMNENKLVMDGSSEPPRKPIEAGDYRFKYE